MSLRPKMMIAVMLLIVVPVTVMGVWTSSLFSGELGKKARESSLARLQEADRQLRDVMEAVAALSASVMTDSIVQERLNEGNARRSSAVDGREQQLMTERIGTLLVHYPQVDALLLFNRYGQVYAYAPDGRLATGVSEARLTIGQLKREPWLKEAEELRGRPLWLSPGEHDVLPGKERDWLAVRTIPDYYSLSPIGTLIIAMKPDRFQAALEEAVLSENGQVLLMSADGDVLAGSVAAADESAVGLAAACARTSGVQTKIVQRNGTDAVVTCMPAHAEGWQLAAVTPERELREDWGELRLLLLLLLGLTLTSALLFDLLFTRKVVRSIVTVARAMKQAEKGRFVQVAAKGAAEKDEAALLLNGFNRMSVQMEELIQRVEEEQRDKRQAEMQALMAQINPHFIYNTLESINSMAVLEGNAAISRMTVSLGKLLRISISDSRQLVPLATEIEHVLHYLKIQAYRYEDRLAYTIDLPARLESCRCLKLIIQPLVENALAHGIDPLRRQGSIAIRVFEIGERDLVIEVADDGKGIDNERMGELFHFTQEAEAGTSRRGVGLLNVHERIRLQYGDKYGLMICSELYKNTTVRIRIPMQ